MMVVVGQTPEIIERDQLGTPVLSLKDSSNPFGRVVIAKAVLLSPKAI
jgi:hypothetical protein